VHALFYVIVRERLTVRVFGLLPHSWRHNCCMLDVHLEVSASLVYAILVPCLVPLSWVGDVEYCPLN
jgi:hypothetical protein